MLGIGICFDQSAINQLVGNANGADIWPPDTLDGIGIAVSPNSTGDYVVQACLQEQGYDLTSINWIYEQQDGVISSLQADENSTEPMAALYGGLWAPNTYRFLENSEDSQVLCRGDTVSSRVLLSYVVYRFCSRVFRRCPDSRFFVVSGLRHSYWWFYGAR